MLRTLLLFQACGNRSRIWDTGIDRFEPPCAYAAIITTLPTAHNSLERWIESCADREGL